MIRPDLLDAGHTDRSTVEPVRSADPAFHYATALAAAGARFYIDNARVQVEALVIGHKVLPLVINAGAGGNSDRVLALYAHYVEYTLEEFARRHPPATVHGPRGDRP
jgi:hypothetical protein